MDIASVMEVKGSVSHLQYRALSLSQRGRSMSLIAGGMRGPLDADVAHSLQAAMQGSAQFECESQLELSCQRSPTEDI